MLPIFLKLGYLNLVLLNPQIETPQDSIPWYQEAIYYQIFVERFRNGDPANDPTIADIQNTYPENIPSNWAITPWQQDWYKEDDYMQQLEGMNFYQKVQLRRYGGDLQGVLDKLDYIEELGVNAIYFNPLNDAPSLHKYDARHYRHIDRNFGPDPEGDKTIMDNETPDDPDTWQWTQADLLFLKVIDECHKRGIRVVMDYSWNHTGLDFWAVNDLKQKGKDSKYKDWYEVKTFNNENGEVEIAGWWGFKYLPVFKENTVDSESRPPHEGNLVSASLKAHIFNVTKRWMDPDGDGDPSDGIDGYRLDVAAEVGMGFWREYRDFVKKLNPEAVLIGEVWWFDMDDLSGPEKMVQGDMFDGLMNYRWLLLARGFFGQATPALKPGEFVSELKAINQSVPFEHQRSMMNISATHDTPRLSTSFFNKGRFDQQNKLDQNPDYKVYKPDDLTMQEVRLFLVHQFTYVGAPQIWNGDEKGMWGANDPDCRKPLWWQDIAFKPESAQPFSERQVPPDRPEINTDLIRFYKNLICMRNAHDALSKGVFNVLMADDERQLLAYERTYLSENIIVIFNRSNEEQPFKWKIESGQYSDLLTEKEFTAQDGFLELALPPLSALVLKMKD